MSRVLDPTSRERNLLEAFLHGCAVIAAAIGITLLLVGIIVLACGDGPDLCGIAALFALPAAMFEIYARLARSPH